MLWSWGAPVGLSLCSQGKKFIKKILKVFLGGGGGRPYCTILNTPDISFYYYAFFINMLLSSS